MPAESLHLVRMELSLKLLVQLGQRRRFPDRAPDEDYLVHCALGEIFGDEAPQPFAVTDRTRDHRLIVHGYSARAQPELQERAQRFADPSVYGIIDWPTLVSKPMPTSWPTGTVVGFAVRTCPVVRMKEAGAHNRAGAEVDAFFARCWAVGDPKIPVDRAEVYRDWLGKQLERHGGARILHVDLEQFRVGWLLRRNHKQVRQSHICKRPDARLVGTLEVTEGDAFASLLQRGIGRHRSFGFGMLLLRPSNR